MFLLEMDFISAFLCFIASLPLVSSILYCYVSPSFKIQVKTTIFNLLSNLP